jgi:hypothetical protein
MMRAPLLRLGSADSGSCFTVLGVDADDRDADLDANPDDADPEERDAIYRGIYELPQRRDREGGCGGGIPRTGELPPSMCVSMASRVQLSALHQWWRPVALLRMGGGGGPSYTASSHSYLH